MEKVLQLQGVIGRLTQDREIIARERDEYEMLTITQSKMMKDMGEEIIILRNQLDKFLNYKK
jgi:hypothetical protein